MSPEPDPLDALAQRIRATQEAAERLARDAAQASRRAAAGDVPPAGWATAGERGERRDEVEALATLLRTLRELVPPDLEQQINDLLRQLLLVLRALIDWWVERLEPGAAGAPQVEVQEIRVD